MRILSLVFLFLFFGALFIVSNENLHLKDGEERGEFLSLYYSWIVDVATKVKSVTGHIIGFDWVPDKNDTEEVIVAK